MLFKHHVSWEAIESSSIFFISSSFLATFTCSSVFNICLRSSFGSPSPCVFFASNFSISFSFFYSLFISLSRTPIIIDKKDNYTFRIWFSWVLRGGSLFRGAFWFLILGFSGSHCSMLLGFCFLGLFIAKERIKTDLDYPLFLFFLVSEEGGFC